MLVHDILKLNAICTELRSSHTIDEEPSADLVIQLGAVIVSWKWYLDFAELMKDLVH